MNFHYVDIGAANNTREAEWNLHVPEATYSLFEPDPVAFEREKLIVLMGAYDKGKKGKQSFQQAQIEIARKRLRDWKRRRA